ncbi:hypothetical protein Cs7R123_58900 [Catellatospora sp. TT07R-123]|uniref:hypothetical protein n=1 Tax=Catellatospora sp. TT07R-123 TaxID=2733863 RepID=UPI001B1DF2A8|nr:hypothetical protein [Catellatospora sp. TT07R-123]GHJ48548.1 hypothetical protein Cs7R123_58900 [Catellatospora sp. TT07R-123]
MTLTSARLLAATAAAAGLLLTGACGSEPARVATTDLVGAWHGSCDADLTLVAGGTATGRAVPIGATPTTGDHGTWRLDEDIPGGPAQRVAVNLDGQHWDNLDIKGAGDSLRLVLTIGDPDDGKTCDFSRA